MTPMDKLREAVARVDSDLARNTDCNPWRPWVVELVKVAKAVLASPPVVLTEAERATVEAFRRDIDVWTAPGDRAILAILDRIAPKPEPAHKPCGCGLMPSGDWKNVATNLYHVQCRCGRSGPYAKDQTEAWLLWDGDRRAEVRR